jgi:leucyl aminopeptidase
VQPACTCFQVISCHAGVSLQVITGDDLLTANYPAVHTVGRAAARPPALIDLSWSPISSSSSQAATADAGSDTAAESTAKAAADGLPLVALVGKGVCFDTGGLDLKTAQGMKLMKKVRGCYVTLLLLQAMTALQ